MASCHKPARRDTRGTSAAAHGSVAAATAAPANQKKKGPTAATWKTEAAPGEPRDAGGAELHGSSSSASIERADVLLADWDDAARQSELDQLEAELEIARAFLRQASENKMACYGDAASSNDGKDAINHFLQRLGLGPAGGDADAMVASATSEVSAAYSSALVDFASSAAAHAVRISLEAHKTAAPPSVATPAMGSVAARKPLPVTKERRTSRERRPTPQPAAQASRRSPSRGREASLSRRASPPRSRDGGGTMSPSGSCRELRRCRAALAGTVQPQVPRPGQDSPTICAPKVCATPIPLRGGRPPKNVPAAGCWGGASWVIQEDTEDHSLVKENAKLRSELEKFKQEVMSLRAERLQKMPNSGVKPPSGTPSPQSSKDDCTGLSISKQIAAVPRPLVSRPRPPAEAASKAPAASVSSAGVNTDMDASVRSVRTRSQEPVAVDGPCSPPPPLRPPKGILGSSPPLSPTSSSFRATPATASAVMSPAISARIVSHSPVKVIQRLYSQPSLGTAATSTSVVATASPSSSGVSSPPLPWRPAALQRSPSVGAVPTSQPPQAPIVATLAAPRAASVLPAASRSSAASPSPRAPSPPAPVSRAPPSATVVTATPTHQSPALRPAAVPRLFQEGPAAQPASWAQRVTVPPPVVAASMQFESSVLVRDGSIDICMQARR